jgi:hypothetical protein
MGIRNGISFSDPDFAAIPGRKFGWGGRIRTFTVLINSEVSYQLDHAPVEDNKRVIRCACAALEGLPLNSH